MRRARLLPLLVLLLALTPSRPSEAAECTFAFGFQELHDLIPEVVGDCLADARFDSDGGSGLQPTSNGLLVWRSMDSLTLFTDNWRTWMLGPCGLQTRLNGEQLPWERGDPCVAGEPPWLGFRQLRAHPCELQGGTSRGFAAPEEAIEPTAVFSPTDPEAVFYLIFRNCTLTELTFVKWDIYGTDGEYVTSTNTGIGAGGYRVYGAVTILRLSTPDQPAAPGFLRFNVFIGDALIGTYWIQVRDAAQDQANESERLAGTPALAGAPVALEAVAQKLHR